MSASHTFVAGEIPTAQLVNTHMVPQVRTYGGGYQAASDWTISNYSLTRIGYLAQLACLITYKGSTMNSGSTGDISNDRVMTITYQTNLPISRCPLSTFNGVMGAFMLDTDGQITLTSTVPNVSLTSGTALWIGGIWLCAVPTPIN